jgi:hypothetical protein
MFVATEHGTKRSNLECCAGLHIHIICFYVALLQKRNRWVFGAHILTFKSTVAAVVSKW